MTSPKDTTASAAAQVKPTGLALLREPFPPHLVSKLPKPTRAQTDAVKQDFKQGIRCDVCGLWHHPKVVHLDYVGHAALTSRLLDADPNWNWEPVAKDEHGRPVFDENGGMWINLTVCGMSRLGYGHPDGKRGGDALKEVIGDALRNAAMRFGAALDLWHKGEFFAADDDAKAPPEVEQPKAKPAQKPMTDEEKRDWIKGEIAKATSADDLRAWWDKVAAKVDALPEDLAMQCTDAYNKKYNELAWDDSAAADEIPYEGK